MRQLQQQVERIKVYLVAVAVYVLYLMLLPQLTRYLVPCLGAIPGQLRSYAYDQCNTVLALDRFISLALGGSVIGAGILLVFKKNRSLVPLLATLTIFAGLAIFVYYWYVAVAEAAVKRAPIILESLK